MFMILLFRRNPGNVDANESEQDIDPEVYRHAESLLNDLLKQIQLMSQSHKEMVVKINLSQSYDKLTVSAHVCAAL